MCAWPMFDDLNALELSAIVCKVLLIGQGYDSNEVPLTRCTRSSRGRIPGLHIFLCYIRITFV